MGFGAIWPIFGGRYLAGHRVEEIRISPGRAADEAVVPHGAATLRIQAARVFARFADRVPASAQDYGWAMLPCTSWPRPSMRP
jgi:hypothetical protein